GRLVAAPTGAVRILRAPCRGRSPIDPSAQRPGAGGGMRACRPTMRWELRAAGSRPYGVRKKFVGVDVLIDPSAQRPGAGGGMRACRPTMRWELRAADSRPYGCGRNL